MKQEKVTKLILRLIKLTKNNEIEWTSISLRNSQLLGGEQSLGLAYKASLENGIFRLYRYKYRVWRDEDNYDWSDSIRLELLDVEGNTEYEFEYENSMEDLYNIVREQSSSANTIIDNILGLNLEIIEATYYSTNQSLNVTSQLQELIEDNRLITIASNDISGDPEQYKPKKLKIKYEYNGKISEVEFKEDDEVILP